MESTILQLQSLVEKANDYFPDGTDIKGFPGISKLLIVESMHKCISNLELLKPYDKEFETIVLKRELAEITEKIERQMGEKFIRLKANEFNTMLRNFTRISAQIRQTYLSLASELPIRTETEIAAAKVELYALRSDTEQLKAIRPELVAARDAGIAAIESFQSEVKTKTEIAIKVIETIQGQVDALKTSSVSNIIEVERNVKVVDGSVTAILSGMETRQATAIINEEKTAAFLAEAEEHKKSVQEAAESVKELSAEITVSREAIAKNETLYRELVKVMNKGISEINTTNLQITGGKDEAGKEIKGYIKTVTEQVEKIEKFYVDQAKKYATQFEEIESLLPGATSAGLAEAYMEQKKSYRITIIAWAFVFVISVVVMAVLGYSFINEQLGNTSAQTLTQAIISILKELPFFIPAVWLAAFASKQHSPARRLKQEYAFKETNAKSFHGHKIQIEALMKDKLADKELIGELVAQLVHITGDNPSKTLESKGHTDDSPMFKFFKVIMGKKEKVSGTPKTVQS